MLAVALIALGWSHAPACGAPPCRLRPAPTPRTSRLWLSEAERRLASLSYRELQQECKDAGLPARGGEKILRARLEETVRRDSEALRLKVQVEKRQRFDAAAQRIELELEQQQRERQQRGRGQPTGEGPSSLGNGEERLSELRRQGAAAKVSRTETQRLLEERRLSAADRQENRLSTAAAAAVGAEPLLCELITTVAGPSDTPLWVADPATGFFAGQLPPLPQYESVWAAQAANAGAALSPRMLNTRIAGSLSVKEVLRLHEMHGADFNEVHLSTCWSRLGRIATAPERRQFQRDPTLLAPLRQQTAGSLLLLRQGWGARAVANTAHSISKLGLHGSPWGEVWTGLTTAVEPIIDDFTPQALANTAWAFATAQRATPQMLQAIAVEAAPRLDGFKPQELASLAWAFATSCQAGKPDDKAAPSQNGTQGRKVHVPMMPQLFDAIAERAAPRCAEFTPQGLANTAWAFAAAGHAAPALFAAIAAEAEPRLGAFKPQELANLVWAFTKVGAKAPGLFASLAERMAARLGEFTPKTLESTAWLKGKVYANRLGEFAPQGLANTAWAYAAAGHAAPALFDAIAAEATARLAEFKPQEICNLAWAFATLDHPSPVLFDALAARATLLIGELFTAQGLANTAWAFAAVGRPAPALFERIAAEAAPRLGEFKPQELANLAWAFATAGVAAPALFDALAFVSAPRLGAFKPQEFAALAWSFAAANHAPSRPPLFDESFAQVCEAHAPQFDDGSLLQLHQWALWHGAECGETAGLPSAALCERFRSAFVARPSRPSRLHRQVGDALGSLGLAPLEDVRLPEGYALDLVVQWRGENVAVQVDGPWRFAGRRPTGMTQLRRRQLSHLGWRLLPLPHWEWSALEVERSNVNQKQMQTYLLYALEHRVI